ncbi:MULTISPECIES: TOPRIM nucleotidyl transferase/hydrolase domain-containing protein [Rhodomicrobium]|uniref:TOPRIM nucleotidyl transferase/hydrolase domain-containing protein n=1 Tax=Rhodomicrobium TaxID=1068 RepID=UPI000B4AE5B0|nr:MULTISPECIES: TOPRIM nucleotidyl transferase/hydrolase domain-containing protein [Rhodomicrobium]
MKLIEKIVLHNFKRFRNLDLALNDKLNILIGENETGKSSVLSAVNLALSGSRTQIEAIGVERLLNCDAVEEFLNSNKDYNSLPIMFVEIWLNEQNNHELSGKNNSRDVDYDGLRMECGPNNELGPEIREILQSNDRMFPFEYYEVKFNTFQGNAYSGYKKFLRHLSIDTTLIGHERATREYVRNVYEANLEGAERQQHQHLYRKAKEDFSRSALSTLNERVEGYAFSIKSDPKSNLDTDLTVLEGGVPIDHKGKGKQCFVKTDFALARATGPRQVDLLLLEEPETHLSHVNMRKLIGKIRGAHNQQLLIATHSNMISARLNLRNTILLHSATDQAISLNDLPKETGRFFIKAPDHGILDFVLSKKSILVEGDAEYILMERFYSEISGRTLEQDDIHILSVDGTSFKRYLDIAKLLNIKVAVIRDNDKNYSLHCEDRYRAYVGETIKVFADRDEERYTFEVCLYCDNRGICDEIFGEARRSLSVQEYMIKHKTDAALALLETERDVTCPAYIQEAIQWISS